LFERKKTKSQTWQLVLFLKKEGEKGTALLCQSRPKGTLRGSIHPKISGKLTLDVL
jgi:hypothetical protein